MSAATSARFAFLARAQAANMAGGVTRGALTHPTSAGGDARLKNHDAFGVLE
jgi:hypothetical protein